MTTLNRYERCVPRETGRSTTMETKKMLKRGGDRLQETAVKARDAIEQMAVKVVHAAEETAQKVRDGAKEMAGKARHRGQERTEKTGAAPDGGAQPPKGG
jgi:vacuolar-type H+-ATPase subunit E/Vma4